MAANQFIVDSDFEDSEFRVPYDRVKQAGHEAVIVGREAGKQLKGKKGKETITAEKAVQEVAAERLRRAGHPGRLLAGPPAHGRDDGGLGARLLPAGKPSPPSATRLDAGRGRHRGRADVTSWPSIKTDLINAGARWVDREVVEDGNLITSRKPDDLQAFCEALLRQIDRGISPRIGWRSARQQLRTLKVRRASEELIRGVVWRATGVPLAS